MNRIAYVINKSKYRMFACQSLFEHRMSFEAIVFLFLGGVMVQEDHDWNYAFILWTVFLILVGRAVSKSFLSVSKSFLSVSKSFLSVSKSFLSVSKSLFI